ncbi:MAG: hypothetical protein ACE5FT_04005 [Candidatus Nanoarchaeia archaeon]
MGVPELLEGLGCDVRPLNYKFLLVQSNGFGFSVRTDKAKWTGECRTLFIYDMLLDDENMFIDFVARLREKIQVLIYARSERLAMKLEQLGFKETNQFDEIEVDLEDEKMHVGASSLHIDLVGMGMTNEERSVVEKFLQKQLGEIESNIDETNSFTWFDSQYCPVGFRMTFDEPDVMYALAKHDGEYVGMTKLLLPLDGLDDGDEIQVENEVITGCSIEALRAAVYTQLIAKGYRRLWVSEYDKTSPACCTEIQRTPVYIMEFGKDAKSWDVDSGKRNPLSAETWGIKRREA